ncbi:hypothetical protein Tco_0132800 [Tanacetum coccineum]
MEQMKIYHFSYQDLEWYEALKDSELKEEALRNKAILDGLINEDDESSNNDHDQEEKEYENEHEDEERCELFDDHELPVCTIRRFEMIKYSFGNDEEYVAIIEYEYEARAFGIINNNQNANGGNGNGGNGGNGNGGTNRCSYKAFLACNPRDYDGKGGAVARTRWIEKMESVIENSRCAENQKVNYAASSFINKALTWWNTQVQARHREAAIGMAWVEFKALLVEEFCLSNEMEKLESEL